MFDNIEFANPNIIYFLVIIPLLIAWYCFRHKKAYPEIQISSTQGFETIKGTLKQYMFHSLFALRMIALALLILVLARPQSSTSRKDVSIEGIDVILAMDISGSMLAQDFKPNRLEASKEVAEEFISKRPNDRIGLVIFSGETFTQCPLTTDHSVLINLFKDVESGMIEDGTALGDGLATAVNRLRKSDAISKVIILLTDGVNNMGSIDPMSAAEIAKLYGIRIYTIGVGSRGMAPYPVQTPFGIQYQNVEVKIDEKLLQSVAGMTDGLYFRATNKQSLKDIYDEIDKLEKSKIDVTEFSKKHEEFLPLAIIALLLLLAEVLLRNTVFRTVP